MAISFRCRRIRIQSRSHFINPFPDQTTEQAVNEVDWLNFRLFCWEKIPVVDPRTAGCVYAPLTFLRSVLACVCTPYRCGCVSTSVCVYASRFLPYYWLSAAFRLRFQLRWATPSFPVPWSHFYFFIPGERGGKIKNFVSWFGVTRLLQKKTCADYKPETEAKTHSRSPLVPVILLTACFLRGRISALYTKLCNQVFRTATQHTSSLRPLFPIPNFFTSNSS